MRILKFILVVFAFSFLAVSCKTESCGCPTQQKKYYKQYGEIHLNTETENQHS